MKNLSIKLVEVCEAVGPANGFGLSNSYGKDGIKVTFDMDESGESPINITVVGDGDLKATLDEKLKNHPSADEMRQIIDDHGLQINESKCYAVEVDEDSYDAAKAALENFSMEEEDGDIFVTGDEAAIRAALETAGVSCEIEECEED